MKLRPEQRSFEKDLVNSNLNVIGDAAGNFLSVKALLDKMPKDASTLFLGDLNDRGSRTKELIQFIIDNSDNMDSINSNHGEMFVDYYKRINTPDYKPRYYSGVFLENGGVQTLHSYGIDSDGKFSIDKSHIDWLESRPMCLQNDKFFFSHASIPIDKTFEQMTSLGTGFYPWVDSISRGNLHWNRNVANRHHPEIGAKLNIHGHNNRSRPVLFCKQYPKGIKLKDSYQLRELMDLNGDENYSLCIDTCGSGGYLTGIHLPTMTFYHQEIIDYPEAKMY